MSESGNNIRELEQEPRKTGDPLIMTEAPSGGNNDEEEVNHQAEVNSEAMTATPGNTSAPTAERNWRKSKVALSLCCMIVGLIVGGVVAYFVFLANTERSELESESMGTLGEEPTLSPSTRTTNPYTLPPYTFPPSSSPTFPFLYHPPLIEDCDRVRSGDVVQGQDLMTERNFDIVLDVTMDFQVDFKVTMELLELEIQNLLLPKLVGCGEAQNRKLRSNPYRYMIGNGRVRWQPASLEEKEECSYLVCFHATFNMDLFLKTPEEQYFVVVNLVEDIFGGDMVESLQLERPPFISVFARSVINQNPTRAPSSAPSLIPSTAPSQEPTGLPSKLPTLAPSMTSSQEPTVPPTPRPTFPPTVAPTPSPTTSPPTRVPTMHPTLAPTKQPTPRPTPSPTASGYPSISSRPSGEFDGYFQPLDRPIRVSCAGDSLTRGTSGGNPSAFSYPSQLRQILGENFEVRNFGRNAVTALRGLISSYVITEQFQASLDMEPDIYLLMLGTNDAKYWGTSGQNFGRDMEWIVNKVRSISPESPPRTILAIPPWVKNDGFGIRNDVLVSSVQPAIQAFATVENLQLVNMYDVTYNQADHFVSDGLHLNQKGYGTLAANWKVAIECNQNGICEVGENCSTCPEDCYLNCS